MVHLLIDLLYLVPWLSQRYVLLPYIYSYWTLVIIDRLFFLAR